MEISRKVMRKALELLDAGVPFALCTVVSAKGSVPGKAGAKMIVTADGAQFGTVGGAGLEEKTKALARQCLVDKKGGLRSFDLAYYRPGALDSLCGGRLEVLVEYMAAVPHILICGGGHVGLEVARLCDQLEYVYSVLDDRAEFASRERFPGARQLFFARPEDFFPAEHPSGPDALSAFSHVIIVGYSHRIDTDILYNCVRGFSGYVGLICSKLKKKEMFARLRQRGVNDADLGRVEAPLGIAIGGETPAEIAVSILAGIIRHHKGAAQASTSEVSDGEQDSQEDNQQEATPLRQSS